MVGPPRSVASYAELLATAARLQRHARELMNRAGRACLVARQFEDQSRDCRERRQAWAALLAHIPLDPDHPVVLCAGCRRVQTAHGWTILPAGVEDRYMAADGGMAAYDFCEDCRQNRALAAWPAIEVAADC